MDKVRINAPVTSDTNRVEKSPKKLSAHTAAPAAVDGSGKKDTFDGSKKFVWEDHMGPHPGQQRPDADSIAKSIESVKKRLQYPPVEEVPRPEKSVQALLKAMRRS